MDLLFTVKQFIQPLPDSYKEFKELLHFSFPKLIDTKYLASTSDFKNIKDSTLRALLDHFEKTSHIPAVSAAEDKFGYTLNEEKQHEAAYDAYMTGLCFLAMSNQLGMF